MKTKHQFMIFHSLLMVFYTYMFISSVFKMEFSFIRHGQFGFYMSLAILGTFGLFHKALIMKFKHYFSLKKGSIAFIIHKVSVLLLMSHFILSLLTGLLMRYNTYRFHRLSRYVVPVLIVFHLLSNLYKRYRLSNR